MGKGSWHCIGGSDQDHPQEKEMQKGKMLVWGGLTNSCEKKRSKKPLCVCSVAESRPTLCNPMDCNLPGSSVHGILQARILEWVAISSSRGSSQSGDQTCVSMSPALAGGSLPLRQAGKPTRYRVWPKQQRTTKAKVYQPLLRVIYIYMHLIV